MVGLGLKDETRNFRDETVESFVIALHRAKVSPNTIRTRLSALATLAKVGGKIRDGRGRPVVTENPLVSVERPARRRPPEKFLAPVELRAFLSVPRDARIGIARDLLVDLALRASELCNASVRDLSTSMGVHVLSVIVKGGHARAVPISPDVAERLKLWLESRGTLKPDAPLLLDAKGKRLSRGGLSDMMISIGKAAGITRFKVRAHTLRHTKNVIRRMAGIDPTMRSALLTHTSPSSITSYEHLLPQELAPARARERKALDAYISSVDVYADLNMWEGDEGIMKKVYVAEPAKQPRSLANPAID